jgi:hypothetical protein
MKSALLLFSGLFLIFAGTVAVQHNYNNRLLFGSVLLVAEGALAVIGSFLTVPRPSGVKTAA